MSRTGRPPYKPSEGDRRTVELMAAAGIAHADMAACLGIAEGTLRKHFKRELRTAAVKANARVAGSLYQKAVSADHPQAAKCAMFWMTCRAGWTSKTEQALTLGGKVGVDFGPLADDGRD